MPRKCSEDSTYRIIYRTIKDDILSGAYSTGTYLPTERELGERFSVDRITVRKSLKLLVDDGLVEKKPGIGTLVKNLNEFYSDETKSNNIVYVLPNSRITEYKITDIYSSEMFYYLQEAFAKKGYTLLYASADENSTLNSISNSNYFCGIILATNIPEKLFGECVYSKTPTVTLNNISEMTPSIVPDNIGGSRAAVSYFYEKGHRAIGMITGNSDHFNAQQRMNGFRLAMQEHGLEVNEEHIGIGDWTFEGGKKAMQDILSKESIPTAIFAANDMSALGAIEAIREHGLSVPEDISIIGFDNVSYCNYCYPSLTSVDINFKAMAHMIVGAVIDLVGSDEMYNPIITVPTQIVERNSVRSLG